ncbi:hypothetical protein GCM10027037_04190 [Mucilaginibacter koreensis]
MLTHSVPFLTFTSFAFYLYYAPQHYLHFKDALPNFSKSVNAVTKGLLTALLAFVPCYYAIASFLVLIRHQRHLPDSYSYTEKISLNWLKWTVGSFIALFISLFFLIKFGVTYGLIPYSDLFAVVGAVLTLYVFIMGYGGLKQHNLPQNAITENSADDNIANISYKNSGLTDEKTKQLFIQLKNHMRDCKPHLNAELNLNMLATQMGITSNQLSQVINQQSQSNFFTFVNNYRVEEVKIYLSDQSKSHYSVLGIALECGFRSKSSFNKIFKEATGLTPLQYQKSVQN